MLDGSKVEPALLSKLRRKALSGGAKGALLGSALTAGAGALYLKGRRDHRAKHAGWFDNEHTERMARALKGAEKKTGKKTENLSASQLERALENSKPRRSKTAGVVENQENLDLLELIKKRMAAGSAMVGDV